MKYLRQSVCLLLILCLLSCSFCTAFAEQHPSALPDGAISAACGWLLSQKPTAGYGDEWTVFALLRAGAALPDGYLDGYRQAVQTAICEKKGVLSTTRATEYARLILALRAASDTPTNISGYSLLTALSDSRFVCRQGVNGLIYTLLALDFGGYACANREVYISELLSRQLSDGGWALSGQNADPDITAMALQALARYKNREDVAACIEKALSCLSALQQKDGGFCSYGAANCESVAQVILALSELGIPLTDSRFVRSGGGLLSALLQYRTANGGFCHTQGGEAQVLTTGQALLALCAIRRAEAGLPSVYGAYRPEQAAAVRPGQPTQIRAH